MEEEMMWLTMNNFVETRPNNGIWIREEKFEGYVLQLYVIRSIDCKTFKAKASNIDECNVVIETENIYPTPRAAVIALKSVIYNFCKLVGPINPYLKPYSIGLA